MCWYNGLYNISSAASTSQSFVTRLTRRVPHVEQELLTLPEHLCSPPVFSGVRVTLSLVLCVCFVDRCLSFCIFFSWPLCCLSLFDILILITPLVSSNSSCVNLITRRRYASRSDTAYTTDSTRYTQLYLHNIKIIFN